MKLKVFIDPLGINYQILQPEDEVSEERIHEIHVTGNERDWIARVLVEHGEVQSLISDKVRLSKR